MNKVPFYDLKVTDGFWAERQKTVAEKTVWAVYDRFKETGRIETMDCAEHETMPHIFWGSDVVKWMEGAAYILEQHEDPKLRAAVLEIVDMIEKATTEDGYYNSYFNSPKAEKERFTVRNDHELYSLGHMIEAAVAVQHAIGDDRLMKVCARNVALVDRIFRQEDSAEFVTPGHQEIELALVRMYEATGERVYLDLSEFFVRQRGANEKDKTNLAWSKANDHGEYAQFHQPVTDQREAVGHAVRAAYLYCAMADLAEQPGNEDLMVAAKALFDDIYEKKMYITGGIGSIYNGEAFSVPYHLPNRTAYAETCAALGLALFGRRLSALEPDGRYGDAVERALYNGMISGLSLEGDAFFYVNPLEIDRERLNIPREKQPKTERQKVFGCSCCPPNLVRLIPSIADFIYTYHEDTLFVHQYIANEGIADGAKVAIKTLYPADGKVSICYEGDKKLALRKPAWCSEVVCEAAYTEERGYLYFEQSCVTVEFVMKPTFYRAADAVHEDAARLALMRGPIVYCVEQQDQVAPLYRLRVDADAPATVTEKTFGGYPILEAKGVIAEEQTALYAPYAPLAETPCTLKFIPYYAFANRGEDNMQVWVLKK